jgi:hypothetical protein
MSDLPTLTLQHSLSKTFFESNDGKGLRPMWGGYMHSHMDAFLVPRGFPEVSYLNFEASSPHLSEDDQAVMFGRVRTRGHIHGKNAAPYFADVILIIQPDKSCSFHCLDSRGIATGEVMRLQADGALNPSSHLRKCPFPCAFLPGELQPTYTARENWQSLECIAQRIVGPSWKVDATTPCLQTLFCFGTSPVASDRKRGNDLATVFDFGTLLCLN